MIVRSEGRWRSIRTKDEKLQTLKKTLATLSEKEREMFFAIVEELAAQGRSEVADAIADYDWEEVPLPPREWLASYDHVGETGQDMYPVLRDDFCELFRYGALSPAGYSECICTGSTGWGKDYFCTTGVMRVLYELLSLENPQHTLGLAQGEPIHIVPISRTISLARRVVFGGICKKLALSKWFKGRYVETLDEVRFKKKGIYIVGGASQDGSALGLNMISGIIDEADFMGRGKVSAASAAGEAPDKATMIYNVLARRMKSRFARNNVSGLLFLVSSKRSTKDFTESRLRALQASGRNDVFVRDYATWHVHPEAYKDDQWFKVLVSPKMGRTRLIEQREINEETLRRLKAEDPEAVIVDVPNEFLEEFRADPDGATRDFAGIATDFASRLFFPDRSVIANAVDPDAPYWFSVADWNTDWELQILWENFLLMPSKGDPVMRCCPDAVRHAHIDLASSQCAAGIAISHLAGSVPVRRRDENGAKIEEIAPVVHVDAVLRAVADQDSEINHERVRDLIYTLAAKGVPLRSVSMDQYMVTTNLQLFSAKGFRVEEIGERRFRGQPYQALKLALRENRLRLPPSETLVRELQSLEFDERKAKIVKPRDGSKDLADAVAAAVFALTKDRQVRSLESAVTPQPRPRLAKQGARLTKDGDIVWDDERKETVEPDDAADPFFL